MFASIETTFADKGLYSENYGFSSGHVWLWELDHKEGRTPRIDAFELWCWRRLQRVPWKAKRSNQSILKEINPEYSLEGLMLKLKLQYFDHLTQTADSLAKSLMLDRLRGERKEGIRGLDGWMSWPMQWTWTWANSERWWRTEKAGRLQSIG